MNFLPLRSASVIVREVRPNELHSKDTLKHSIPVFSPPLTFEGCWHPSYLLPCNNPPLCPTKLTHALSGTFSSKLLSFFPFLIGLVVLLLREVMSLGVITRPCFPFLDTDASPRVFTFRPLSPLSSSIKSFYFRPLSLSSLTHFDLETFRFDCFRYRLGCIKARVDDGNSLSNFPRLPFHSPVNLSFVGGRSTIRTTKRIAAT